MSERMYPAIVSKHKGANLFIAKMKVRFYLLNNSSRPRWLNWMRRPTGDQEVAGSTPAEVGNILSWRLIMKYFYGHSLPSPDSRRAVVSFWRKNVHNTEPLSGLSLPSKRVVR